MLKRKIRNLAIAGATIVSAMVLATGAATGASAAAIPAASAGRVSLSAHTVRAAHATPDVSGFLIFNYDNLCLGISGARDRAPAVQWKCEPKAANQLWHLGSFNRAGWVQIVNGDDQCLGVAGESQQLGAQIYGWTCNGHPDQYWLPVLTDTYWGDYVVFVNYHSGLDLSIDGCNAVGGAAVNQWGWVDRTCQLWNWPHVV